MEYTIIGNRGVESSVGDVSNLRVAVSSSFEHTIGISGGINVDNSWIIATKPADFPTAVSGVITLLDNATYMIFNAGNNQEVAFRLALNDQTLSSSEARATANSSGRAESVTTQGIVFLTSGSYIEVYTANNSAGTSTVTVTEMNTVITKVSG